VPFSLALSRGVYFSERGGRQTEKKTNRFGKKMIERG